MRVFLYALLCACTIDGDTMPPGHPRNLATVPQINIGNSVQVEPTTSLNAAIAVLQLNLDVAQPLTLSLNCAPVIGLPGEALTRIEGYWIIQWGSGGGTLQNEILVDGGTGVVVPVHASQVNVNFLLTVAPPRARLVAMVGGGVHNPASAITFSESQLVNNGSSIQAASPYMKRCQVLRGNAASAVLIEVLDGTGAVVSSIVWAANILPFTFDLPLNTAAVRATNNGAAPMFLSTIFELAL